MPTSDETELHTGGCHCGAVQYQVKGPLRGVVNCHCTECTRLNGHFGPHSKALKTQIEFLRDEGLTWYRITEKASRGFCRKCGTGLFWSHSDQNAYGIVAGSLDQPTGLDTIGHIFVAEKADFYTIADGLPQFDGSSDGQLAGDYR